VVVVSNIEVEVEVEVVNTLGKMRKAAIGGGWIGNCN
jgi:hypothetical protein